MNIIRWTVLSTCMLSGFAVAGDGAGEWPEHYRRLVNEFIWLNESYVTIANDFREFLEPVDNVYRMCHSLPYFERQKKDFATSIASITTIKARLDELAQEQNRRVVAIGPEIDRCKAEFLRSKQAKVNNGDGEPSLSVDKQPIHTQEQTQRIEAIEPEIRRSEAEFQMSKQAEVNNGDGEPSLSVGKQPKPDAGYKKRYILAGGVAGAACLALGMAVGYKIALRSSVPA